MKPLQRLAHTPLTEQNLYLRAGLFSSHRHSHLSLQIGILWQNPEDLRCCAALDVSRIKVRFALFPDSLERSFTVILIDTLTQFLVLYQK